MRLILGGAYQGKLDYAMAHGNPAVSIFQGTEMEPEIDFAKDVINSLHRTVLAQLRGGLNPLAYMENHLEELKSKTIICDDISCGVVPVDREMRLWRETVGRVLVLLSGHADEVIRVFYGLGTKVKRGDGNS